MVSALFLAGVTSAYFTTLESGRIEVRAYYKIIKTFRHWVALHGGVYAPRTKDTPSNPYLDHIPEREVVTPSGKVLTLVNPAYATRQIHEVLRKTSQVRGHLTSLNPIREENAADPWETAALMGFESGKTEFSELSKVEGASHMRLMRPLMVTEACMPCHERQGYKVGEIRGGLSVSVPMAPHYEVMRTNVMWTGMGYGTLWLIGSISIVFAVRGLNKRRRERDEAHELLKISERRFRNLAEAAPVGIFRIDSAAKILFANKSLMEMLNISEGGDGATMFDHLHPDDSERVIAKWHQVMKSRGVFSEEFRFHLVSREEVWAFAIIIPEGDRQSTKVGDRPEDGFLGTIIDITGRKRSEKRIHQLAYSDASTGMPNEAFFLEQLHQQIDRNSLGFVASIELSGIGDVIGTFGLEASELIIYQTGKRLADAMPPNCIAARVGPRLFRVLYIFKDDEGDVLNDAVDNLFQIAQAPFDLMGASVVVNVFMGVSVIDPEESTAKSILTNVEIAHHEAVSSTASSVVYFNDYIKERLVRTTQIVSLLHAAIRDNDFKLFFQPQINLKDNTIVGCEALIRWPQKSADWISPAEFIPIAEKSGLIGDITTWTVDEACRTVAAWATEHGLRMRVGVNISAEELISPDFHHNLSGFVENTGLPPELLEIEITETALMKDTAVASSNLHKMRDLGATVAIDDFGTGQSSLAYLKSFPIDRLKIDQSFIKNAPNDKADQEIIISIIKLAHSLGMDVIAEGAEEKEHIDLLVSLGCDEVQGYYIAKPMPADEFLEFVKTWGLPK